MPSQSVQPRITIGADPELFVRHLATGNIVSAHDLMPGTKAKPYPVSYGAIQVDGVAAEFNIDPSTSSEYFQMFCNTVIEALKGHLGSQYELVIEPTASFEPSYFETLPVNTRELGCNPDFNGWTGQVNDPPETPPGDRVLRTAAGHLHFGWTDKQDPKDRDVFAECCVVARQMDYYLGIWSLMWDPESTRRQMYGKAGSFRPKPYGMEYRPLSNRWLSSPQLTQWVWNAGYYGMQALFSSSPVEQKYGDLARRIIDENIVDWDKNPEFADLLGAINVRRPPVAKVTTETRKPKKNASHMYWDAAASAFTVSPLSTSEGWD